MWCDDFDGDLYRLVPEAREVLAPIAGVQLYTVGMPTGEKINCPTAWNTDRGLASFFGFEPKPPQPDGYWTNDPVIPCTLEEAVRDLWSHNHRMVVNDGRGRFHLLWDAVAIGDAMMRLLYVARGWEIGRRYDATAERKRAIESIRGIEPRLRRFFGDQPTVRAALGRVEAAS